MYWSVASSLFFFCYFSDIRNLQGQPNNVLLNQKQPSFASWCMHACVRAHIHAKLLSRVQLCDPM